MIRYGVYLLAVALIGSSLNSAHNVARHLQEGGAEAAGVAMGGFVRWAGLGLALIAVMLVIQLVNAIRDRWRR